ncbi:hypothetical protein [Oleiagrimonas soli]|uniref:Regulator of protease activity HflC (Stomatin/prohibitin superfamily) n=1 Tax=Oleiagrimonas soli TaxID=1543381 RepID=A0A099CST5_9GAMM|nr:hypothetical protein [Oleiagrimonas soli]KGI76697.1 hypothetical protein LF63_0114115 [Oleiagrimonas soli]MBB6185081.1 regulator of protease activity HflC (stomatin/prohibitin superfamily) [Oleiagrimonas soli]
MSASIALLFLIVFSALTLGVSVKRIPEGQVYTLRRIGQPAPRLLQPGTHWVWPVLEHITHRISLVGRSLELDGNEDDALRGTVYWQVLEPERADAVIERAEALIREHAQQAAPQLASIEGDMARNAALKDRLNAALAEHGLFVARARLHGRA